MERYIRFIPEVIIEKSGGPLMVTVSHIMPYDLRVAKNKIDYGNMSLKVPWGLSSGWADSYTKMKAVSRLGAGLVISKTITYKPRKGNPRPRIIRLKNGMINSMGLPNKGIQKWCQELHRAREIPNYFMFSVKGDNLEEWKILIDKISNFSKNLELNFSCPNVSNGIMDLEATIKMLVNIRDINKNVNLFLKLSPQYADHELINLIKILYTEQIINGISLFNTIPTHHRALGNPKKIGGYSGPILFRRLNSTLRNIRKDPNLKNLPLLAVGGIESFTQAMKIWYKYQAVPLVLTSFLFQGPFMFKNWFQRFNMMKIT